MTCIFFGKWKTLPSILGTLSTLPVNKYGLGLHNPVTSAAEKYTSLLHANYNMIGAVTGEMQFSTADHLRAVKEERQDGNKYWYDENDAELRVIVNYHGDFDKSLFLRANHTGYWLSVRGTTVTGTVLPAT